MRDIRIDLDLEKMISIDIKEDEDAELKVREIIEERVEIDKKTGFYLSSFEIDDEIEWIQEDLIYALVKKAIDSFDPYFVQPDSADEYDGESRRIADKIQLGMSSQEIAEIMKKEFKFSFSAKFTREDFFGPAETVWNLLTDSLNQSTSKKNEPKDKLLCASLILI